MSDLDLNYQQCLLLIEATALKDGVKPTVVADDANYRLVMWKMLDGNVYVACDRKRDRALLATQPHSTSP